MGLLSKFRPVCVKAKDSRRIFRKDDKRTKPTLAAVVRSGNRTNLPPDIRTFGLSESAVDERRE
jgi:hypothetical protein